MLLVVLYFDYALDYSYNTASLKDCTNHQDSTKNVFNHGAKNNLLLSAPWWNTIEEQPLTDTLWIPKYGIMFFKILTRFSFRNYPCEDYNGASYKAVITVKVIH